MTSDDLQQQCRIILFHKHGTSARTRFLRFAENTVCAFAPLPALAQVIDETVKVPQPTVGFHPAMQLKQAAEKLQLPDDIFELESEYVMWVDAPGGAIRILLVRLTSIDPPFEAAEAINARFIDLTQARDLSDVELLLLRRAYEVVLGG